MSLQLDRERLNVKGGGYLSTNVLASGGVLTTLDRVGYLDETGFKEDKAMVEWRDERGFIVNAIPGEETLELNPVLQQTSIDEYNLIRNAWNEYRQWYYQVKLANGRYQEIFIPLAKIVSPIDVKFKAPDKRLLPVRILALMPKGAVTADPTGFNVPVDTYGVIVENAAAIGPPTHTNGSIYTAAV
jgi:hypothetical protein